ncbi:AAA family ATPase [bacterium]|nr:AAA family ATPase [bacterium]
MQAANSSVLRMLSGQRQALSFLEKAALSPRGGYIFHGPDGVGKRTAALLFAASINSPSAAQEIFSLSHPDVAVLFPFKAEPQSGKESWLADLVGERSSYTLGSISPDPNPSWVVSIERIRELRKEMLYPPRVLNRRVVMIFDFDRVRDEGANAFLKTLEEPQADSVIILTTSRPFSLPATIRSRCKMVRFNMLEDEEVKNVLIDRGFGEDEAVTAADFSSGNLKRALLFLSDKSSVISEDVMAFLEGSLSEIDRIRLMEKLGYRAGLDVIIGSFMLVFKWVLRSQTGRRPRWKRLDSIVSNLSQRIPHPSLLENILLTQRMSGRVILNPTPSLFLYEYLTSLKLGG